MTDPPKNPKSHKRHKSSALNIGYYFSIDNQGVQSTQLASRGNEDEGSAVYEGTSYGMEVASNEVGQPISSQSQQILESLALTHNPVEENPSSQYFHYNPTFQQPVYGPLDPSGTSEQQVYLSSSSFPLSVSSYPPQIASSSSSQYPTSIEQANMYNFNFPKSLDYAAPVVSASPAPSKTPKLHNRGNMSISSHFNLFSLTDEIDKKSDKQTSTNLNAVMLNEILMNLISVDVSNINHFLLGVLYKFDSSIPLDDFYTILYNSDDGVKLLTEINFENKIDKTIVSSNKMGAINTVAQILNVFKNPGLLFEYLPQLSDRENKFNNINYHELLRTFLAIKILYELLVLLPRDSNENPQNHTIPRLSIYKTYYIVCQKLISMYPSTSNTPSEQQKIILGQSKLGKLIKLVYPNLLIKRLGSRGESKYKYLGVFWNENIVNDDIKRLCDENELIELNDIFAKKRNDPRPVPSQATAPLSQIPDVASPTVGTPNVHGGGSRGSNAEREVFLYDIPSNLSFIKPSFKYPLDSSFSNIRNGEHSWFTVTKNQIYKRESMPIKPDQIKQVFLEASNLEEDGTLLDNFLDFIIKPIVKIKPHEENLDLGIYLLIIIELLPYFLLTDTSNDLDFLKHLRLNLLDFIRNYKHEILKLGNYKSFILSNATIFLVMLKKLVNLNDLMLTFVKLITNNDTRNLMLRDFKGFLLTNSGISGIDDRDLNRGGTGDGYIFQDLIYTLLGFNFESKGESSLNDVIPRTDLQNEVSIIDNFFKKHVLDFLGGNHEHESPHSSVESNKLEDFNSILNTSELEKLCSLISLVDQKLLTTELKSRFPILIFNHLINFVLNDILKQIFFNQQEKHQQLSIVGAIIDTGSKDSSFGSLWVFNSFIQEYLSLIGEIVSASDLL
ncbi:uncharacterized protein PRCAT00001256001 [Priceomyces carsonii]|uniref:uncharacterized protein n=1 Tax=Priceomyces carsonii TaxID=28549 RepID=UPI002EDB9A9E|nr:unnamed protein product [Priceomyces carsonii]